MRFIRMAIVSFAALAIVSTAKADILLEPYLGYTYGQATLEVTGGNNAKWDTNNLTVGARLGWQWMVAMAGLDYSMPMSGKWKESAAGSSDYDLTGSTLWAYAGARLPLIRAWAGYGLANTAELKATTGTTTLTGGGLKVGASFTGIPLLAINVEYIMNEFKKLKTATGEQDLPGGLYGKGKNDMLMVSISAPLSF